MLSYAQLNGHYSYRFKERFDSETESFKDFAFIFAKESFIFMFANFPEFDYYYDRLGHFIIMVLFTFILTLVMMNLLIALMGDTYEKV